MAFTRLQDQPETSKESPMPQLPATLPALGDAPIAETSVPTPAPEQGPSFVYYKFFSNKANNALDARMSLGKGIQDGHPFLQIGDDEFVNAEKGKVLILENFDYWCTTAPDHAPNRAWLTNPGFGTKVGGSKVNERTVCLVAVIVDDKCYGALLETRSGTKSIFVKQILGKIASTMNPQNDKDQKLIRDLGPLMSSPPRLRLGGVPVLIPKSGGDFPYSIAHADVSPLTSAEIAAFSEWASDEAQVETFKKLREKVYEPKIEKLKALAKATKDVPE